MSDQDAATEDPEVGEPDGAADRAIESSDGPDESPGSPGDDSSEARDTGGDVPADGGDAPADGGAAPADVSEGPGRIVDAVGDRDEAVSVAATALRHGDLVVAPTDTVYGVTADAFNPEATQRIFMAKRRQKRFPLPVLIRSPKQLMGLVTSVPETAERLMAAYWPGPLTLVVRADPNLAWDLGKNDGTVAVRMPMDDVMLDIIRAVGPLATTSANLSGQAAATTAGLARGQLGDSIAVYVDGGRRTDTRPSTIVDLTRPTPGILRSGPLPDDEVLAVARGEVEPHQASAPQPRHKPVSPGGPAETTPSAAGTESAEGATAADTEVATGGSDTQPGPAAGAAASTSAGADHGDAVAEPAATTSTPRGDAIAVDHRAAAAAGAAGGSRRSRRRPRTKTTTGAGAGAATDAASRAASPADTAAPTEADTAAPTEADGSTGADTAAPTEADGSTGADESTGVEDQPTAPTPAVDDGGSRSATSPASPRRRARTTRTTQPPAASESDGPTSADDEATEPDPTSSSDDEPADPPRRARPGTSHHVARDHRAG